MTKQTDREPGFYWVAICEIWQPARWTGAAFRVVGSDDYFPETHFDEIGPEVEPPKSERGDPPTVPSYPIAGDGDGGTFVDIPRKPDASQGRD